MVKKQTKTMTTKKASAIAIGIAVAGAALGGAGVHTFVPQPVEQVTVTQIKEVPVVQTVEVNRTVEVPVETVVEVEVDNGNLGLVLDYVFDNEGMVEYLTDDLDADEVSMIVDRIVFVNEIKTLAAQHVDDEFADELDRLSFEVGVNDTITFDEDDVERVNVQDDSDEILIEDIDFDDLEADLELVVRFEHDDENFEAVVQVEIQDGEVDDMEIISVSRR